MIFWTITKCQRESNHVNNIAASLLRIIILDTSPLYQITGWWGLAARVTTIYSETRGWWDASITTFSITGGTTVVALECVLTITIFYDYKQKQSLNNHAIKGFHCTKNLLLGRFTTVKKVNLMKYSFNNSLLPSKTNNTQLYLVKFRYMIHNTPFFLSSL